MNPAPCINLAMWGKRPAESQRARSPGMATHDPQRPWGSPDGRSMGGLAERCFGDI